MPAQAEVRPPSRLRALVVDDEGGLAQVICRLLHELGYETDWAGNGEEALRIGREVPFDVVLCDIIMPQMNGKTLFTTWQAENPALAQKVIFITGADSNTDTHDFITHSGRPFLYKPFVMSQLVELLQAAQSA